MTHPSDAPDARAAGPSQIKLTVKLPATVLRQLEDLAESQAITRTQALRDAIELYSYVVDEQTAGGKLLIERPNAIMREIVLK